MPLHDQDPTALLDLLAGCRRNDRNSQRQLYTRYYSYGLSICLRYTRDRETALEAVNDGFMKVFRDISRFDPHRHADVAGSFQGWFKKVLVYTAIDHYRADQKHLLTTDLDHLPPAYADSGEAPLQKLSFEELLALIRELPPAYRTVFNLYVIDGYSHEEIARQLDISVGTSKSNLARARTNLQALIKKTNCDVYARSAG